MISAVRLYFNPLQPSVCGLMLACNWKIYVVNNDNMIIATDVYKFDVCKGLYLPGKRLKCQLLVSSATHLSFSLDSTRIHQELSSHQRPNLCIVETTLDLVEASLKIAQFHDVYTDASFKKYCNIFTPVFLFKF